MFKDKSQTWSLKHSLEVDQLTRNDTEVWINMILFYVGIYCSKINIIC